MPAHPPVSPTRSSPQPSSGSWPYCSASPTEAFFASELIGLTGSGSGGRAARAPAFRVERSGERYLCRHAEALPSQSPIVPCITKLIGIVRKTVAMVEPIRQALNPLADRIELALIYGSVSAWYGYGIQRH